MTTTMTDPEAQRRLMGSRRPPGVQTLQLLVRNLSPAQRKQFARHDYFDVIGGDTVANASPTWELSREFLWPDRRIGRHDLLRRFRQQ